MAISPITHRNIDSIADMLRTNEQRAYAQWRAAAMRPPGTNAQNFDWYNARTRSNCLVVWTPNENHAAGFYKDKYESESRFWKASLGREFHPLVDSVYRSGERLKLIRSMGLSMLH